jgi:hypothetical protein
MLMKVVAYTLLVQTLLRPLEETRIKLDRKEKAIVRAKNLGLTNEEIEALRYTIEEK